MIDAHLRKLRRREVISAAGDAAIRGAVSTVKRFPANSLLARAGEPRDGSLLVIDGWVGRSKHPRGYERQITGLAIAGDFADLHGLVLRRLDHDVVALTDCRVAVVPHARLEALFEDHPHLSRVYRLMSSIDASIEREWATSLGRRSRASHMAHFFCEMFLRLDVVGQTAGNSMEFPLTQSELAECLGATPVHVNRVLQELRSANLVKLGHRRLTILDEIGLQQLAKFDPQYLYMQNVRPRGASVIDSKPLMSKPTRPSVAHTADLVS